MSLFGFNKNEKKKENIKTKELVESKPTILKKDASTAIKHEQQILLSDDTKSKNNKPDTSLIKQKSHAKAPSTTKDDSLATPFKNNQKETSTTSKPIVTAKISKPIIVHFLADNEKIMHDITLSGKIGEKFTENSLPSIKGYERLDHFNHKITSKLQEYNIHYKKLTVNYNIIAVTEDLQPIPNFKVQSLSGTPGEKIKSSLLPKITGYYLYKARQYYVPSANETLKIIYGASKHNVTVRYKTTTNTILSEKTLSSNTGDTYKLPSQAFEGYTLVNSDKLSGKINAQQNDIELIYKPIECQITVDFLDETGNSINVPSILKGDYKTKYSIKIPQIEGYELNSDRSKLQGIFLKEKSNIVLRFKKSRINFKINLWFDKKHTQSAGKPITVTGIYKDKYSVEIPHINGYKPSQSQVTGDFSLKTSDIDIDYDKQDCNVTILLEDQAGRLLNIPNNTLSLKGKWDEGYNVDLPSIKGYTVTPNKIMGKYTKQTQTIEVHYTPLKTTLTINYLDSSTNKPIKEIESIKEEVLVGSSYAYDPLSIEGYQLQSIPSNATGTIKGETVVNFEYKPYPAKIFIHYYDSTMTTIKKDDTLIGVHGQEYNYTPKEVAGYKYVEASDKLKGVFIAGRKDINLIFNPTYVSFSLMPINQFGESLNKYIQTIKGLVNQEFSAKMPTVPGFTLESSIFRGKIKSYYQGKVFKIAYTPTTQSITIHSQISGGVNNLKVPFPDEKISGTTDSKYSYHIPSLPGHHTKLQTLEGKFKASDEDITVAYIVDKETYQIHFIDENGEIVGGISEKEGSYGDAIDISNNIPKGYHLPEGEEEIKVILKGKNLYQVSVIPNNALIELIPQTQDGINLDSQIQIFGKFNESKSLTVPDIPGFEPIDGDKISIKFNLNNQVIPIKYQPQKRQVTVRYISLQGQNILSPKVISGKYQEEYQIKAEQIPGYVPLDATTQSGVFGLEKNIETTFIYRADSDNYNPSITDLEDYLSTNKTLTESSTSKDSTVSVDTTEISSTPAPRNLLDDFI